MEDQQTEFQNASLVELVSSAQKFEQMMLKMVQNAQEQAGLESLTPVQAMFLLNMPPEPVHPGDLKKKGVYFGTNPSYIQQKLITLGYLKDVVSQRDKRKVVLFVTPEGQKFIKKLSQAIDSSGELFSTSLGFELADFVAMMDKMSKEADGIVRHSS